MATFGFERVEPRADIVDAGSEYRVLLAVPGAHHAGMEVTPGPTPGTLSIKAQVPKATHDGRLLMDEGALRSGKEHKRLLPIAWDADVDAAKTSLDAGVLTIVVPKKARGQASAEP